MDESKHIKKDDQKRTKLKKKAIIEALRSTLGVVTPALERVGVNRATYYNWLKADKEFAEAIAEADDIALDTSESKLHQLVKEGVPSAVYFHLKTKGKKRGYVERQEHEVTQGVTINVEDLSERAKQSIDKLCG